MSREPLFFKDTCFAVDEMHAKGHVGCSQASFMSNYMQVRPEVININTSAAECSNSRLSRIKKSISYMDQKHDLISSLWPKIFGHKKKSFGRAVTALPLGF